MITTAMYISNIPGSVGGNKSYSADIFQQCERFRLAPSFFF